MSGLFGSRFLNETKRLEEFFFFLFFSFCKHAGLEIKSSAVLKRRHVTHTFTFLLEQIRTSFTEHAPVAVETSYLSNKVQRMFSNLCKFITVFLIGVNLHRRRALSSRLTGAN